MNDNDDKNESRSGWKRSASSGSNPDRIPSRNTAPAGTPAHKAPSTSPRSAPVEPEPVAPPPVAIRTSPISDRPPPDVDTISPARTVGGQTARLKAKQPPAATTPAATAVEEDLSPRAKDDKKAAAQKPRSGAEPADDARAKSPTAAARGGSPAGAKGSRGGKDGTSWEADVKISDTELAAQGGPAAGVYVESRWPFAIAIGAVAFAIGSLLPLPFRKQIVGSGAEPTEVATPRPVPSAVAHDVGAVPARAPSAAPAPPPSLTAEAAAPSSSAEPSDKPSTAPATAGAAGTARTGPASSGGKNQTKGPPGKAGRVGDIF